MMDNLARTTTDERPLVAEEVQYFSRFRQHYDDPEKKWQIEVLNKVATLVAMTEGWDSYDAPAVKRDAALFAVEILLKVMGPRSPAPQVEKSRNTDWRRQRNRVRAQLAKYVRRFPFRVRASEQSACVPPPAARADAHSAIPSSTARRS